MSPVHFKADWIGLGLGEEISQSPVLEFTEYVFRCEIVQNILLERVTDSSLMDMAPLLVTKVLLLIERLKVVIPGTFSSVCIYFLTRTRVPEPDSLIVGSRGLQRAIRRERPPRLLL